MGSTALIAAFVASLYGCGASLVGIFLKRRSLIRSSELAVYLNFALLTTASAALLWAFLVRDFSLVYVLEHSSRDLPNIYAVTAFWAGQEGSLMLWAWLLAANAALALLLNRKRQPHLLPWASFIFLLQSTFFMILLNFVSNPFAPYPGPVPLDGYGLNPFLQNLGMIIHPPTLFLGYAGLTVPCVFGLASLLSGCKDSKWIDCTRLWTLGSWIFLSAGILLGAAWAYVELGWGGYWAWDPVENASLMPWITLTAFIHSAMVWQRKGMLKLWSINLIIFTYFLTIFGTFVTRSGLISSVHAYSKSSLGYFFLVFIILFLGLSLGTVWWHRKTLKPDNQIAALFSLEGFFLLTNYLFSFMAFSVFWGTILPVLGAVATGARIAVGPGYYNRVNVPAGILLLLLIAICPILSWQGNAGRKFRQSIAFPAFFGLVTVAAISFVGLRNTATFLVMVLSAMVLGSVLSNLFREALARRRALSEPVPVAALRAALANSQRYGGYIVHLGMALIFLGLAGAPLTREVTGTLRPGESLQIGEYKVKYLKMEWLPADDRLAVTTRLQAFRGGKTIGILVPERRFYMGREDKPTSEVSIVSSWFEDLYVILTAYSRDGTATLRILVNPMVPFLWAGGFVAGLGALIALWPGRRRSELQICRDAK